MCWWKHLHCVYVNITTRNKSQSSLRGDITELYSAERAFLLSHVSLVHPHIPTCCHMVTLGHDFTVWKVKLKSFYCPIIEITVKITRGFAGAGHVFIQSWCLSLLMLKHPLYLLFIPNKMFLQPEMSDISLTEYFSLGKSYQTPKSAKTNVEW